MDSISAQLHYILVGFAVHNALQRNMAILDYDADGLKHRQSIALQ